MIDFTYLLAVSALPIMALIASFLALLMTRGDEAQAKAERLRQKHS